MAPIKFEEQIKEKLEGRHIQPSSDLWDALSNRLDDQTKSNNKRWIWWLGMAASIVILLTISFNYFGPESVPNHTPVIVNEQPKLEGPIINSEPEVVPNEALAQEDIEDFQRSKVTEKSKVNVSTKDLEVITTVPKSKEAIAQNDSNQERMTTNAVSQDLTPLELDKKQIDKAVADILKFEANSSVEVTDAQIDSLLKSAQRELFKNRILSENSNVVNADALLQDVEEDLGQSFRTKVYEALKDNYEKVKTAVANRNN